MNSNISQNDIKRGVIVLLNRIREADGSGNGFDAVREALLQLTRDYTTCAYSFTLAMEFFIEKSHRSYMDEMESIIRDPATKSDDPDGSDIAFAAYYALSLIYKKDGNIEALEALLSPEFGYLNGYPLQLEVYSRYYKRVKRYSEALQNDRLAIRVLQRRNVENYGVLVSFASTVCKVLDLYSMTADDKESPVTDNDIRRAVEYVDRAIEYNPDYPKYYFLKAQLIFYRALRGGDPAEIGAARQQATEIIDIDADITLYEIYDNHSRYTPQEREQYSRFKNRMERTVRGHLAQRFPVANNDLDALKANILNVSSQDMCVSSSLMPPVPQFQPGDKYFFVCYSSADFHSVYCDLIELYRSHIPYLYDEHLRTGEAWQGQIRASIEHEDCIGVVFYLSRSIFNTNSLCEEMQLVRECKKPYFCINLEDNDSPSRILTEIIVDRYNRYLPHAPGMLLTGEQMKQYLEFFDDNVVYITKFRQFCDDGTSHFQSYTDALRRTFSGLYAGN